MANLPYNVATPMVADLLDDVPEIQRFFVMVQREVAERFVARPGSKAYGALSVKVAYWATARLVGDVPPTVFLPKPNVMSSLVEITRRPSPAVDADRDRLFASIRAGFAHRRKTLHNTLAGLVDDEMLIAAGIVPNARAEELDVEAWGRLAAQVPAMTTSEVARAKLTLSLRITGVREDGYHLLDAEMVTLELARRPVDQPGVGIHRHGRRAVRERGADR